MAAGEISKPLAWGLVCGTGALGLAIVYHFFSALICQLYCVGMVLGTVYTVPPFRWKNNPALAAFSIAMVRGLLLNIGLHHAASTALGLAITWPAQVLFISAFMTVFATVIAIAKDLPDVAGDIKFGVKTLASSLGVDKAAHLVTLALMGNYVMGVGVGLLAPGIQNRALMVVAHAGLAGWLAVFASRLQPDSIKSIKLFYRNIWALRGVPPVPVHLGIDCSTSRCGEARSDARRALPYREASQDDRMASKEWPATSAGDNRTAMLKTASDVPTRCRSPRRNLLITSADEIGCVNERWVNRCSPCQINLFADIAEQTITVHSLSSLVRAVPDSNPSALRRARRRV